MGEASGYVTQMINLLDLDLAAVVVMAVVVMLLVTAVEVEVVMVVAVAVAVGDPIFFFWGSCLVLRFNVYAKNFDLASIISGMPCFLR